MNFYEPPDANLRQGDILDRIPFPVFSIAQAEVQRPGATQSDVVDLTTADLPPGTKLAVGIETSLAVVVSQSCDLDGRKPIVFARIAPCADKIPGWSVSNPRKIVEAIGELSNPGKRPTLFYLPAYAHDSFTMEKSVVELLRVVCLVPSDVVLLRGQSKLRLAPAALQAFQERLAYCVGRFGAPEELYYDADEWALKRGRERLR